MILLIATLICFFISFIFVVALLIQPDSVKDVTENWIMIGNIISFLITLVLVVTLILGGLLWTF